MEPTTLTPVETAKASVRATKASTVKRKATNKLQINLKAKARTTEVNSDEHAVIQPKPVNIPGFNEPLPEKDTKIQAVDSPLDKEYLAALAFAEEPVTIVLPEPTGENAPTHKEVWVNGRGIEVLVDNRWLEYKAIPFGQRICTKRKYVEVIARSKHDAIKTKVVQYGTHEDNLVVHRIAVTTPVTIVHDPSGVARGTKGGDWFERVVRAQI